MTTTRNTAGSSGDLTELGSDPGREGRRRRPLNVLYTEDNPGDVRLIELLVESEAGNTIELRSVESLQTALTALKQGSVDILLLDLSLPDSTGIDTITRVVCAAPEVPVVVLTGLEEKDLGIRALRAGAQDLLSKNGLSGEVLVRTLRLASERAQLERKLRESERRYALAAEGSNDGVWDWDLQTNQIHYSSRWKRLLGCSEAEIHGTPDEWFARVHPDDLASLEAAIEALRAGQSQHLECEHRLRTQCGAWRWMLCRGAAARDSQGACYRMAGSLTDITPRKETEEELRRGAFYDSLTGLANRALFHDRLQRCVVRAQRRPEAGYAVLFLDLDRFKWINDSFGHQAGDRLLVEVGQRVAGCVRPNDTVARLGGDEFAILVDEVRHEHHALEVAERILGSLKAPTPIEGKEVTPCASIGIALGSRRSKSPGEVLRDADIALHQAKQSGKGRYAVFEPRMHAEAVYLARLEADLRRAPDEQQFALCYQPIVCLTTGRITSFEALLRWEHPMLGRLLPDAFLDIAEETGVICDIGCWALAEACGVVAGWQKEAPHELPIGVHVNLSAREFRSPGLERTLSRVLAESVLAPGSLCLELTESTAMEGARERNVMRRLRTQGIRLAIDDFGTGYSSLAVLHKIPVECLKIDQSFVRRIGPRGEHAEVIQAIMALASNLGMETIAEGVETRAQAEVLKQIGCRYGQGFLFSPPVPAEDAKGLLFRRHLPFGCDSSGPQIR